MTIFNRVITQAKHVTRRGTGNAQETRKKLNNFADFSAVVMLFYSLALTQRNSRKAIMSARMER